MDDMPLAYNFVMNVRELIAFYESSSISLLQYVTTKLVENWCSNHKRKLSDGLMH